MANTVKEQAKELIAELDAVKQKLGLTDEQLYQVATDETRKEFFVKLLHLVRELSNG